MHARRAYINYTKSYILNFFCVVYTCMLFVEYGLPKCYIGHLCLSTTSCCSLVWPLYRGFTVCNVSLVYSAAPGSLFHRKAGY